ncbi:hypothetical protein [Agromyces sp. ZXT2-6]|uniref:hypothetical protein n=1 Tax=Agromyces sp. ZXT2-6 TaxID=3461153 RepID=UPI0040552330
MDTTGDGEDRGRADAAAMSAGQQAAFGDGMVRGADGHADAGDREDTDDGLVAGGPIDVGEDAGGSGAGAGEVAADRARAEDAHAVQEEEGLAPGESD